MRRRPTDFRRPVKRRFSKLFWLTLCGLVVLLFIVLSSQDKQPSSRPTIVQRSYKHNRITEGLNITEEMLSPHSITRQLSDQISLAKSIVVIAKESNNLQFAWELSAQIRNSQILLSNAATRQTPLTAGESETAIRDMALLLYQAQQFHYDSATMIMKLKTKIQSLEEQVNSVNEKSSKYGQIAAEEVPKSLNCLGVRLTVEWFRNSNFQRKLSEGKWIAEKLEDNNLYHFCVFSDNILATSVVVNSTALNSKHPDMVVFHLVTDEINYAPMKAWFSMNSFRGVTVEVQKFEDFGWLNASYVPVLKQLQDLDTQNYYFSGNNDDGKTPIKYRNPKYLSMLNHLRFYIPEVFPALEKVVFLDDDVVVQKDLSPLFSIDLKGNVNGAVETCMETFHRYHKYLNYSHPLIRSHFDPDACGWAFGMNIFDLVEWRKKNVTGIYHYWQERNVDRTLWKLGTLPPGLLTFYGLTEPLDPKWHVLGLGYTNVDPQLIEKGAVLHFNGNSKPWLKIGIEKYKPLWEKYVDYSHPLLQQCNFH
ncbi:PREDICTED: probable galacturonosyltransferase 10 [Nelumbo nucifera]|uniref:Hexosyltransferase n=1 Tax=Nelumbo nucifera TaxID=4432 RepID=A0A1U8B308_NELNU|nr:PREDICTED: probable galacturonosyltransferase 10 [Nelumbo nucifera]XP_010275125.1 PREDICTED: probable galacturonosyltransferase 10 [Nelumbo nucifera]XP_010275126.1 PREDICTED: probable galacturonosyltransferase 10 [Nelumbo nucifera]XP_010275127.1 PREDICTED: probable galacturonosyltransferase 10 [Nelumbo nucifera]XP_010275128.1 PREDICTED: probable galacturonosyltransferase 10 [Nelumbo nucifera]XP_019055466.1 PREDICTED: probable galacturonosyltransferase 10 [Nelumbo nucifera]